MSETSSRTTRLLLLALICGVAILFRFWRLATLPPGFHFDESFEALEAWRILTDPAYRPVFLEGNFGVTPLNVYVAAAVFAIGELLGVHAGPVLMRGGNALVGVLSVLAAYGCAAELRRHDRRGMLSVWFPLWVAATLAVMRWHVHFSRMGIEPIWVPLEWFLAVWALLRGWRTGSWWAFAAAGAVAAAALYTYQGAWVLPFILGGSVILLAVESHFAPARQPGANAACWTGVAIAAVVALALVAPLLLYFSHNLDLLLLRPEQVNVVGATTSPADAGMLANLRATLLMYFPFGETGDLDPRRNIPGAPVLNLWLALPFAIGLLLSLWRIRRTAYWITLLGLLGLLSVGFVTEYAPHFHRILGASAPTAVLCGMGLDWLWNWRPARARLVHFSAVVLIMLAAVTGWRAYFVRWASLPDLYHAFDEGLWQIGNWIADQPADEPIYLSPRDFSHPTLAFAWQTRADGHGAPITFDGRSIFPVTQDVADAEELYISITHEDFRTPLLLPEVLPDATETLHFVDWSGAPYATVWTRAAGTDTARPPFVEHAADAGDGIRLWGYDLQPAQLHAGDVLYVQLHWLVDATPTRDWTVYVHLSDPAQPDAPPLASRDEKPGGGSLITTRWLPGWRVLDEHQILLPTDLSPGTYAVSAGMYDDQGNQLGPISLGEATID